jgi:hypothetical protein
MTLPSLASLLPLSAAALLLCSCAVDTPQARIARNPVSFESLNARQQGLVEQGLIEKGMPKRGVLLALGTPEARTQGQRNGDDFERWIYTRLQPVYSQRLVGSYYGGYGWGCGGYGYRGFGIGLAPTIDYLPMRSATVWFKGGKVDAWERIGPQPRRTDGLEAE